MAKFLKNKTGEDRRPGIGYAVPFFLVLAVLTVVSFMIPLRPTVSESEKRQLAEFPEFSLEALVSGDYFDDISLWFSDTFPGREGWIHASNRLTNLHGHSDIAIDGALLANDDVSAVQATVPTAPLEPVEAVPETMPAVAPQEAAGKGEEQEGWGGVRAAEEEIALDTVIQIGDTAFNPLGFSQQQSERYAASLNKMLENLTPLGVRVISCPAPTSVGILIEREFLPQLNCAPQDDILNYMHGCMDERVIKVDTVNKLLEHNSEYIFFRTDHHWTALGAYYAYEALCETLGMEAAPLDSFETWDHGRFIGSTYGKARWPSKLKDDTVTSYIPNGDITMLFYTDYYYPGYEMPILQDVSTMDDSGTYITFMSGGALMEEITNESIPEGSTCLVIKDSFGNCFVPFLTQNYHKVYSIDYRKFYGVGLEQFCREKGVDDLIVAPYLIATQSTQGNDLIGYLSRFPY